MADTRIDVLVFGGGAAGLWLLDELHRRGVGVLLLESQALGANQTVASQGIIHGGVKYTLAGLLSESAEAIREMPAVWRACLAGQRQPDLTRTPVAAEYCHLWRTAALKSRLGMVGARVGLRSSTARVAARDRPPALASCPGGVFRVDEQVIDPAGFVRNVARNHAARLLKIDADNGVEFVTSGPGTVEAVRLVDPRGPGRLDLRPGYVVFAAGAGNAALRERVGLSAAVMQRRPLHMVLARGRLPMLYGHCVDGAKTRVTVTAAVDSQGHVVWQVGGQVAEDGVRMSDSQVISFARRELQAVLPRVDLAGVQWSAYSIDRAEPGTPGGSRPPGPQTRKEGNVITGWPTKLALVPQLAKLIVEELPPPQPGGKPVTVLPDWPRPEVALPPWEESRSWQSQD